MSRRYWGAIAALIGLTALLALGWWLYERHEQRERSYQAAYQQYRDSKQIVPPGVIAEGERSVPDPQAYREEWRSERDLEAQRDMAEWAFLMVVVSGLSVFVTSVGVVYVALTLKATRDAVQEAGNATAQAQRHADITEQSSRMLDRPYLYVITKGSNYLRSPGKHKPFLNYKLVNYGRTPATILTIRTELSPTQELSERDRLHSSQNIYEVIPPGDATDELRVYVKGGQAGQGWIGMDAAKLVFRAAVEYEGPGGTIYEDRFCFCATADARSFVQGGGHANNQRTTKYDPSADGDLKNSP